MAKEVKGGAFGPRSSRDLGQSLGINEIPPRNMIRVTDYKSSNCWEIMNCPENLKKKCWAYRLNLGKECWILRENHAESLIGKIPGLVLIVSSMIIFQDILSNEWII